MADQVLRILFILIQQQSLEYVRKQVCDKVLVFNLEMPLLLRLSPGLPWCSLPSQGQSSSIPQYRNEEEIVLA